MPKIDKKIIYGWFKQVVYWAIFDPLLLQKWSKCIWFNKTKFIPNQHVVSPPFRYRSPPPPFFLLIYRRPPSPFRQMWLEGPVLTYGNTHFAPIIQVTQLLMAQWMAVFALSKELTGRFCLVEQVLHLSTATDSPHPR
jgi:hypothetical protein